MLDVTISRDIKHTKLEVVLPHATAAAVVAVVVTPNHRGQWRSDSVEAVLAMDISCDSMAAATSGREGGCCRGGVVWVRDGCAILGLQGKRDFVCLRSKFLHIHTTEVRAQNL